jgi:inner membrane protein
MDSITQITLGAAVGEAVAGRDAGARAPLWGAFFGLLPDLDVLANPLLTEIQALTLHRSATHSLLFIALVTLGAALGLRRFSPKADVSTGRWGALVATTLITHVGLDCLTTYGTQLFWPFSSYPVIYSTIFIIDPVYTVPLAAGLLLSLRWAPRTWARRWSNYAGLALSSVYLLVTVGNKLFVQDVFTDALRTQVPSYERVFTTPTPFNNLLWRGVAEAPEGYYIGLYSVLDPDRSIDFRYVPKGHARLGDARTSPVIEKLRRFSRGYYTVRSTDRGEPVLEDLRFGRNDLGLTPDGQYLFTYRLVENADGTVVGMRRGQPPLRLNRPLLRQFIARIRGRAPAPSSSDAPSAPRRSSVPAPSASN